jgi:hypothetical protein
VILNEPSAALRNALIFGAVVSALSSWYLGRHARKMDRAARARSHSSHK